MLLLRRFCRVIDNREIGKINPEAVTILLQGSGSLSATWMVRCKISADFIAAAAMWRSRHCRHHCRCCRRNKDRGLFDGRAAPAAGRDLDPEGWAQPQVPTIYRNLLLLLYGSGMRIGEPLRLVLHDVDLSGQSLLSATRSSSKRVSCRSDQNSTASWRAYRTPAPFPLCRAVKNLRYSPRAMADRGTRCGLFPGSSTSVELPESVALSASCGRYGCKIFVITPGGGLFRVATGRPMNADYFWLLGRHNQRLFKKARRWPSGL